MMNYKDKIQDKNITRQYLSNPYYCFSEKELQEKIKNAKEEFEIKEMENGRILLVAKIVKD